VLLVVMGFVLALNLALWRPTPVGRIFVEAAGLVWILALWAAPRPLGPKRLVPLLASLALGGALCLLATAWGPAILAILAAMGGLVEVRRRWRLRPAVVQASSLNGTIEYGATNITATLVQEFTAGWKSELARVMTDRAGRFELPQVSPGPTHRLMFSRPGTETLRLVVTIAPEAPPLSVRLRPWSG
jgi:hypothetical protein